jgi:hypothetical protein
MKKEGLSMNYILGLQYKQIHIEIFLPSTRTQVEH